MVRRAPLLATWGTSLLLLARTGEGLAADVLGAFAWLALLVAAFATETRARTFAAVAAGTLASATWILEPAAYPPVACALVAFAGAGIVLAPRGERRPLVAFVAVAALPAIVAGVLWLTGDARTREMLRYDWTAPEASFATFTVAARVLAVFAAIWTWWSLRRDEARRWRGLATIAVALVVVKLGMRVATIGSMVTLPEDAGWSESSAMATLLKLRVGAPLFAPFSECSAYSYAPTAEILHHPVLSLFGLDLSLVANRALGLGWQLVTSAILAASLAPFFATRGARAVVWLVALLVATSSFLSGHVHPDHVLNTWFALALGLALHATRLSPRTVIAGLVLLPALATGVKLTGAGVGLGLAFAFALPLRRRTIAALAGGAVASVLVLVVYERVHPGFWSYTFGLQASHPILWREAPTIFVEPAGRVLLVALFMLGVLASMPDDDARGARSEVVRVLLVSLGFALPSTIAYLKVGGRENSLLPLSIGASVACARMLAFFATRMRGEQAVAMRAFMASAACVLAHTVTPLDRIIPAVLRDGVKERHARMVEYVKNETAAGRRPVLPQSTYAWIRAGRMDVPRERWQTMGELHLGGHPGGACICRDRIVSDAYDSVIVDRGFFDPDRAPGTAALAPIFARDYDLVEDRPIAGGLIPSIRLYRRRVP